VDHATLNRWVVRYSPLIALAAKSRKRTVASSWGMDETTIIIKGEWVYLYRVVDKFGDTVDFMLSERRDEAAATAFFKQAIDGNGLPEKVLMDKSGANLAGLENINVLLVLAGLLCLMVDICQVKYLNNLVEQDHRFTCALWVSKRSPDPCWGFKAFHSAQATLDGIETAHMIRKGQLAGKTLPAYQQFINLAG